MSLPTHRRRVGDHTYEVTMLPAGEWRRLQTAIWPVLIPILTQYLEQKDDPEKGWTLERVVAMLSAVMPLEPESYRLVMDMLQKSTRVEGQKGTLDMYAEIFFAESSFSEIHGWLRFALEVMLVPFLRGMPLDDLALLHRRTPSGPSLYPTTSTGSSGASSAGGTGA